MRSTHDEDTIAVDIYQHAQATGQDITARVRPAGVLFVLKGWQRATAATRRRARR